MDRERLAAANRGRSPHGDDGRTSVPPPRPTNRGCPQAGDRRCAICTRLASRMNALDPNTLESIAEIICDSDGPHHRQYWELEKFFANAGWALPPYDERGRLRWTREMLLSHQNDPTALAAVICRLADPREYRDR